MRLTYQILKVFKKGLFLCATKPKIQCKFRSTFWRKSTSSSYFIEHKTIIRGFHRFHSVARRFRVPNISWRFLCIICHFICPKNIILCTKNFKTLDFRKIIARLKISQNAESGNLCAL